jgi:multiple sugar transport system ATP-binding protein
LPPQASAFAGRRALYGIRPEHIELTQGLEARVGVVEPTGAEMHIYADVGQEEICVVTDERVTLRPGDMLSWKPVVERVLLFDAETNEALPLGR